MAQRPPYHMTPDQFRAHGRRVVDWIADYMESVEDLPVQSQVVPGAIRELLPVDPPREGVAFEQILGDVDRVVMPGITHWQSPHFHAYFPANTSGPSILGDLLASGLGVQGMLWFVVGQTWTEERHVVQAWQWIRDTAAEITGGRG